MRELSSTFWSPAAAKEVHERSIKVVTVLVMVGVFTMLTVVALRGLDDVIAAQAELSRAGRDLTISFNIGIIIGALLLLPTILERFIAVTPRRIHWPWTIRALRRHRLRASVALILAELGDRTVGQFGPRTTGPN